MVMVRKTMTMVTVRKTMDMDTTIMAMVVIKYVSFELICFIL
jgi:hypothetical protein